MTSSQVRGEKDAASHAKITKEVQLGRLSAEIADYKSRYFFYYETLVSWGKESYNSLTFFRILFTFCVLMKTRI